jgi:3-isopropylmalate/(R)-2-methylmalate dehydratase large subunit
MTISEKILARASGRRYVEAGEYVTASIDTALVLDDMGQTMHMIAEEAGVGEVLPSVWDPQKVVVVFDHYVPAPSVWIAEGHSYLRQFVRKCGIRRFHDFNSGIGHNIMVEKGYAKPGMLIVGNDSHATTYGAINAAGTGIGMTELAYVLLTGELYFKVPETIRVTLTGKFPDGVFSKDLVLYLAAKHGQHFAQYAAIEFAGPAINEMSTAARVTMSNMSVDLGAKFAIFPPDQTPVHCPKVSSNERSCGVESDPQAVYERRYAIDVSKLEPYVACPHTLGNSKPVHEVEGVRIDQAVLGSCTNGTLEDLAIAAQILRGRKVHAEVRLLVSPGSLDTYRRALGAGILGVFVESGAIILNSSCGVCFGQAGCLASGEKCISTSGRNAQGRLGALDSEIYLGSPATVAASAIAGEIIDPRKMRPIGSQLE